MQQKLCGFSSSHVVRCAQTKREDLELEPRDLAYGNCAMFDIRQAIDLLVIAGPGQKDQTPFLAGILAPCQNPSVTESSNTLVGWFQLDAAMPMLPRNHSSIPKTSNPPSRINRKTLMNTKSCDMLVIASNDTQIASVPDLSFSSDLLSGAHEAR